MRALKIAVLASGGGTNLQALIDAQNAGKINGTIELVFSNRKNAYALERARLANIACEHISAKSYPDPIEYDKVLLSRLKAHQIDLIVLAGYLKILSPVLIQAYQHKIINIHPSLLPAFGGDGFYGIHVHNAVYQNGAKVSGATVHFVTEGIDAGPIILQKAIPLEQNWQATDIQAAVLKIEHPLLVEAVSLFCDNRLEIKENRVYIQGDL